MADAKFFRNEIPVTQAPSDHFHGDAGETGPVQHGKKPDAAQLPPTTESRMTTAAAALSYFAAAPLIVAALMMIAGDEALAGGALVFMQLYGAALIVFFGGVRWGVAVMKPGGATMGSLVGAALPLIAALPLFLQFAPMIIIIALMALFALLLLDDLRATRRGSGAPEWYLGVRLPLTALVEIAFAVALAALVQEA